MSVSNQAKNRFVAARSRNCLHPSGVNVHGKPVALLPPEADCRRNQVGVSKGSICKFDGKTHYIKPLKMSETRKTRHISYPVFNHQLAESTPGIQTAGISFFKKDDNDTSIYIASEHINDIKFIEKRNDVSKLKSVDVAKWVVASTFIYDLHARNVGYTHEGIVALDLDGHNSMLSAYINICDKVLTAHETTLPMPKHSQPNGKINQLWCQAAKEQTSSQTDSDSKFYDELCTDKQPKIGKSGFIKHRRDSELFVKSKPKAAKAHFKKNQRMLTCQVHLLVHSNDGMNLRYPHANW